MSAPRTHVDEWLSTITAVMAPRPVYEHDADELQDEAALPDRFVVIYLTRRVGESERACGGIATRGFRLATRYVGMTLGEVDAMSARMWTLERTRRTAIDSTPLTYESSDEASLRMGRWEMADIWTYSAPIKES